MLIEVAYIILISAIIILFSREFGDYIKKIFAYQTIALVLPLLIASGIVVYFESFFVWLIYTLRNKLQNHVAILANLVPFNTADLIIAGVIFLMLCAVLPVTLFNLYKIHTAYKPFEYTYRTSMFIWLICALLIFG